MIKITNEIDGKLYELVPAIHGCKECAFDAAKNDLLCYCKLSKEFSTHGFYKGIVVCSRMYGIWKEVKDAD